TSDHFSRLRSVLHPHSPSPGPTPALPEKTQTWEESNEDSGHCHYGVCCVCLHYRRLCSLAPQNCLVRWFPCFQLLPSASLRTVEAGLLQHPVALFAFDRALPILSNQQTAGILLRPLFHQQPYAEFADHLVDGFVVLVNVMDFFDPERRISERIVLGGFKRAHLKFRGRLIVFDLSNEVIFLHAGVCRAPQ